MWDGVAISLVRVSLSLSPRLSPPHNQSIQYFSASRGWVLGKCSLNKLRDIMISLYRQAESLIWTSCCESLLLRRQCAILIHVYIF